MQTKIIIKDRMEEIKEWFEEASIIKVHQGDDHEFAINRGFKVTHYFEDNTYSIQDTRLNDFYTKVSEEHMELFRERGFIIGTNIIMYDRNIKRVSKYLRLIEGLYTKIAKYKENLYKNKSFYTKRIRNCNENIHKYHDLMQFYKSKVDQFKSKSKISIKSKNEE